MSQFGDSIHYERLGGIPAVSKPEDISDTSLESSVQKNAEKPTIKKNLKKGKKVVPVDLYTESKFVSTSFENVFSMYTIYWVLQT